MRKRATSATPAGVPRSRAKLTRRERIAGAICRCCDCGDLIRSGVVTPHGVQCFGCENGGNPDCDDDFGCPDDGYECDACSGTGIVVECCDDICQGRGWCMHGDSHECRRCGGNGYT